MSYKTIDNLDVKNKRVFLRVDFNVPLTKETPYTITDDTRIRATLPTIEALRKRGAKLIVASHLGRPKGEPNKAFSLTPVKARLQELLHASVQFAEDCIGPAVENAVAYLKPGEVLLLENLRFHKEEEKNDPTFSKQLAALADIYVDDAFGASHRAHASIEGITHFVKEKAAGYLLQSELNYLGQALNNPKHPFTAIIGGAKISGKIDVIESLLTKADSLLVGGGMMFTFLKAQGIEVGKSLVEEDKIELAKTLLKKSNGKIILPLDTVVAAEFKNEAKKTIVGIGSIPKAQIGLDIGPETEKLFSEKIASSKTILWNGPMGVFEMSNFAHGTLAIARALADATKNGATTIVGGGDSVAALDASGLRGQVSHVSTGGGATLEFLEGKILPGVAALEN